MTSAEMAAKEAHEKLHDAHNAMYELAKVMPMGDPAMSRLLRSFGNMVEYFKHIEASIDREAKQRKGGVA